MLRILLSSFLASSLLSAVTIDELVKNSFEKNYDLKSLNKSIQVANEQIKVSKNWENPMLAFKTNNIGLNKPLSNQKEYGVEIHTLFDLKVAYLIQYYLQKTLTLDFPNSLKLLSVHLQLELIYLDFLNHSFFQNYFLLAHLL